MYVDMSNYKFNYKALLNVSIVVAALFLSYLVGFQGTLIG